ncbi:Cytoplasmic dynein 1 intermediate chain 2 [Cyphomyrmex costatus]|uniref:Cytoplasmic dynein 1 intermediate chain 2 n=1 Tax=Cyphomyrmex costatus TaxID=456900 RepID=A0A151K2K0_9HYME|nr:Cytoplasmic dynein 1 intermediate chain 2 [Cyphomyrmex costatus]
MNWSSQFPELLAASYNNNDDVLNGVYLFIWNTKFKKNNSRVYPSLSVTRYINYFCKIPSKLDLGYSRQGLLWSNRVIGQPSTKKDSHTTYAFVCYSIYCK